MSAAEEDPVDRAATVGLRALGETLKASDLDEGDRRAAVLCVGADCIMSVASASTMPRDTLLRAIKALLEAPMGKGWLPKKPPEATMVLVLSDEGVEMGPTASKAVH